MFIYLEVNLFKMNIPGAESDLANGAVTIRPTCNVLPTIVSAKSHGNRMSTLVFFALL